MLITTRWKVALRLIASALVFESALSFHQPVCHKHRVARKDAACSSSPLPASAAVAAGGAFQRKRSLGPGRPASVGNRPGQRRKGAALQDRASAVLMLASGGEGAAAPAAAAVAGRGDTNAPQSSKSAAAAADAPSSEAQQQASPGNKEGATQKAAQASPSRRGQPRQHHDSDFLFQQKLESVRAALLCGGVGAACRLLAVGAGAIVPGTFLRGVVATPEPTPASVLFCVAAGFAQGALFGLTYRYVVRSDRETLVTTDAGDEEAAAAAAGAAAAASTADPPVPQMDGFTVGHLGDGAVAAFALTSALGQSEVPLTLAAGEFVGVLGRGGGVAEAFAAVLVPAAPFLPRAAGDLLLYSVARAAIDRALDQGAIKPFP